MSLPERAKIGRLVGGEAQLAGSSQVSMASNSIVAHVLILAGGRVVAAEEGGAHTRRTSTPSHLLGRRKQTPG